VDDITLVVLLIAGFFTVLLSLGLWQEKREMEQKDAEKAAKHAEKEARRAAAAAAHGGAPA